ncbi:MAG: cobalamin biosynthesis protein [Deferrisomatales bacterium]
MSGPGPHGPVYAVALTRAGAQVAARLVARFPGTRGFAPSRYAGETPGVDGFDGPVAGLLERLWPDAQALVLIMAAGIAVRTLAPLLAGKAADPAVVVMDPQGAFAVPILGGHLAGANALAREIERRLGATAVITTATDAAGRPAAELWAHRWALRPEDQRGVVAVNAAWANGEPVGLFQGAGAEELPGLDELVDHLDLVTADPAQARGFPGVLLAVTCREPPEVPAALVLRPVRLVLGVGCRRGACPEEVERGVRQALGQAGWSAAAVGRVATVDVKRDEPALRALAATFGVPLETYPAEALARVPVLTSSQRVQEAVGTPRVSEAAARMGAARGPLLLPKVRGGTWTLAVALGPPSSPRRAGAGGCPSNPSLHPG